MASVRPGKYNPLKPDIELFDYKSKKRYGLKLDGSGALQVGTISQDDTVHIRTAGKKIGDFDEQRSWKGGRGIENLSSNPSGYWDSMNAWTLSEEHLHQTLLWEPARGLRNCQFDLPSRTQSLTWVQLFSATRYLASKFVADESFSADYARMWVRRVGQPGTLTVEICADNAGTPGTVAVTATLTAADVADVISYFKQFNWTSTTTITSTTTYHIKIYGASTDNKTNHWEVGGLDGGSSNYYSSNNSSWNAGTFRPFYYIADADVSRTFFPFMLDSAMYVVDKKDDQTTASKLWINGDRGVATSAASTSITDSAKSWTTDRWAGAYVKIVRGTGAGQVRAISSNTSTALTISTAWDKTPSTDSEFVIFGTRWFTEIATTGLSVVSGAPVVSNRIVYFPQGTSGYIRNMVYNATTKAHAFAAEGTNQAFLMLSTSDAAGGRIWAFDTAAKYASAVAYSTTPTALTFTSLTVGGETYYATGVAEKDGLVYVFKENGIWNVSLSNVTTTPTATIVKLQTGIEKTPSPYNGFGVVSHQQFLYYSWMHSLVRVYGSSHDDIGQDWAGWGLPDGREGIFTSLDTYTSLLVCAVDAGSSGTSSVLGWDGLGWHELVRGYDVGKRIRMVKVQPCQETRNRLWTDMGGDLVFQEMPLKKSSPRLDNGSRYMHEAVIESSVIDMGTASALPKFIKELTVYCENLGDGNEINIDYQVDDAIHTSSWVEATTLFQSPEATAFLGLSNVRKFVYRLRINSSDNTAPVDILGVVPNGYARVPYKMVWTLRCRADNIMSRGRVVKPDELMRWLLDSARYPGRLEMRSQYELAHKFFVIIHPPRMFPYKPAQNGQAEESVFTIVLEEA